MTTIRVSCFTCGEAELNAPDITLMVCSHAPWSYYMFWCPTCLDEVRKPADEQIISLLMSGGVEVNIWDVPAEVLEPKPGAVLTYDDLLDLALALDRVDELAPLALEYMSAGSPLARRDG